MTGKYEFEITTRDRVLRAWENSTELTRAFEIYSKEIDDDDEAAQAFSEFAEDEGRHAAKFLAMLERYDSGK